jgi:spore coat polysaccharide biosynthesis protein SpsF
MLFYLVERLKRIKNSPPLIIATTTKNRDDVLVNFAAGQGIFSFRGGEDNVLERFYLTAKAHSLDVIVRITSDCPLIDPAVVDEALDLFINSQPPVDYVSNTQKRTFPRGMDVEVFSFKALEKSYLEAKTSSEQEHVTPYIYGHPELFKLKNFIAKRDLSTHRWTVDTPEDFDLIQKLLTALYPTNPHFSLEDLAKQLEKHPEWALINQHIDQKKT